VNITIRPLLRPDPIETPTIGMVFVACFATPVAVRLQAAIIRADHLYTENLFENPD